LSRKKIHLYPDRPESSDNLKFAHKVVGQWLEDILKDISTPYRIAITGKLGSGKSTIVERAIAYFESNTDRYATAYVDVWKLDKNSARRSAILRIAEQFKVDVNRYKKLKASIYGRSTENSNANLKDFFKDKVDGLTKEQIGFMILLGLSLGGITVAAMYAIDPEKNMADWLKFTAGFAVTIYTIMLNFVSKMILQVKSTVSREPFVGPEEFEEALSTMLEDEKVAGKRAIIVFDNIDRAPKARIEEILTGISAFFDNSKHNSPRDLVILVPFSNHEHEELDEKTVQKFFDASIPLPELVPEDLIEFSKEKLEDSGWLDISEDIAELIDLGPFYTPRQILHFLNELISKEDLADRLEQEMHKTDEGAFESYLPMGAITQNRVFFAKCSICEKIWPGFLKYVVNNFLEPNEVFRPKNISEIFPVVSSSDSISKEQKELEHQIDKLRSFITATEGIPSSLPESFEAVLYFKGSDAEISIPGGFTVRDALVRRDTKKISEFINDNPDKNIDYLNQLFRIVLKRNKGHYLRIRNAYVSVAENIDVNNITPDLKKAMNDAILLQPKIIEDVPLKYISLITETDDDGVKNPKVWSIVDNYYQNQISKGEDERNKGFSEWQLQYLSEIFGQPNGIKRTELDPEKIPTQVFLKNENIEKFNNSIPHEITVPGHALEAIEYAINESFQNTEDINFSNVLAITESAFHLCGEGYGEISKTILDRLWQKTSEVLNSKKHDQSHIDGIVQILDKLPNDSRCASDKWTPYKQNLNGQHAKIKNAIDNGCRKEILGLLIVLLKKVNISDQADLTNKMKEALNNSQGEDFEYLLETIDDDWLQKLWEISQAELTKKMKQQDVLSVLFNQSTGKSADFMINHWDVYSSVSFLAELVSDAPDDSKNQVSKKDVLELVVSNPGQVASATRYVALAYAAASGNMEDLNEVIDSQINDKSDAKVTKDFAIWVKNNAKEKVSVAMESAKSALGESTTNPWTTSELSSLILATLDTTGKTDDYFYYITDKAINRGMEGSSDETVVNGVKDCIVSIWNSGIRPSEQHINAFEAALKSKDFIEKKSQIFDDIKGLRNTYDLKKSLIKGVWKN
jgi:hypothetical protein